MYRKLTLPFLLALFSLASIAATRKPAEPAGFSDAAILEHLKFLASESLQGRGTATPGGERAARYIADHFRRAGLEPRGDGRGFMQSFEVLTGARVGPQNSLSVIHPGAGPTRYRLHEDFLPAPASGARGARGEVVFAGYGIEASSLNYNDYAGVDVRDKVVLLMRHSPDGANPHAQFDQYSSLSYKIMTARDKGARAILLCVGPHSPREIEELGPFGVREGVASAGIPAQFIKREVARKLLEAAGKQLDTVQREINETKKPQSFMLPGMRVELQAQVIKERGKTANVIGYLPGNSEETIVIGAHHDHLGLGEQSGSREQKPQGKIHHGADDNASGTAGVIELAHYFGQKRPRPRKSMLFIAFGAEEMGLLGSRHFVDHPTLPLDRIVAMLNLDMVGRLENSKLYVLGADTSPFWKEALDRALTAQAQVQFQLSAGGSGFGGSDHQSFYQKNIPVLHFFTGIHTDYHKPSDTWDRVNVKGEADILRVVARVAEQLLERREPLPFVRVPDRPQGGGAFRIYLGTVPDYSADVEGVRLEGVRENSPAARAGIQAGDVLISFAGRSIKSVEEYSQLLREGEPGVAVPVIVLRKGEKIMLTITPEARR